MQLFLKFFLKKKKKILVILIFLTKWALFTIINFGYNPWVPKFWEGTFPSQILLPSQIHLNYSVIVPCFSSPSQKENLLNAFSNQNVGKYSTFSNGNTFSAPSQMEYMFYISRNLLRFFSMEIPSQLLLKWSTCSTSVLMISYEIRKSLESKNSHSAHQSTYLFALCMVWAIVWPNF